MNTATTSNAAIALPCDDQVGPLSRISEGFVAVRFLQACQIPGGSAFGGAYSAGDVAGFPKEMTEHLKQAGIAVDPVERREKHQALSFVPDPERIRFLASWGVYVQGDVVGLAPADAQFVVAAGLAERANCEPPVQRSLKSLRDILRGRR